jgi:hypothetical protein
LFLLQNPAPKSRVFSKTEFSKNLFMNKIIFIVFILLTSSFGNAQNSEMASRDSIAQLGKILYGNANDSIKKVTNLKVELLFEEILLTENSSVLNPDSLRFIKVIFTDDAGLKLFTWAVPLSNGSFLYSGFIQKFDKKRTIGQVFRLKDNSTEFDLFRSYPPENWPGAVYSRIIETKFGKQSLYTLFGWIGGVQGATYRIIETMIFTEDGNPVFGQPVFSGLSGRLQFRVIFKYNSQVPFHLAYEKQLITGSKKQREYMIVFNRLIACKPEMGLSPGLKVADYSLFDGFISKDDHWVFVENVDVRMPEQKNSSVRPPDDLELAPATKRK